MNIFKYSEFLRILQVECFKNSLKICKF